MEIQEKHRLTILNAKCEYVCAASTLVKKMNYGEDVSCCINKLYLASRIIKRLECYCFNSIPLGTETVSSNLGLSDSNTTYPSGSIGQIIVNGSQVWSLTAPGTVAEDDAVSALLTLINLEYVKTSGGGNYTFNVTADPYITSITVIFTTPVGETTSHDFKVNTVGVPSVSECNNCIEDKNLHEMYALLNQLLS